MDEDGWHHLCARSLGVQDSEGDRRTVARQLLQAAGQPVDVLGIGAAEAAIALVTSHGAAGNLDEVLLGWEQTELLAGELGRQAPADVGLERATACTKALLEAVVAWVTAHPSE